MVSASFNDYFEGSSESAHGENENDTLFVSKQSRTNNVVRQRASDRGLLAAFMNPLRKSCCVRAVEYAANYAAPVTMGGIVMHADGSMADPEMDEDLRQGKRKGRLPPGAVAHIFADGVDVDAVRLLHVDRRLKGLLQVALVEERGQRWSSERLAEIVTQALKPEKIRSVDALLEKDSTYAGLVKRRRVSSPHFDDILSDFNGVLNDTESSRGRHLHLLVSRGSFAMMTSTFQRGFLWTYTVSDMGGGGDDKTYNLDKKNEPYYRSPSVAIFNKLEDALALVKRVHQADLSSFQNNSTLKWSAWILASIEKVGEGSNETSSVEISEGSGEIKGEPDIGPVNYLKGAGLVAVGDDADDEAQFVQQAGQHMTVMFGKRKKLDDDS